MITTAGTKITKSMSRSINYVTSNNNRQVTKEPRSVSKNSKKMGLKRCPYCRKWDSMSLIPIKTSGFKITCDYAKGGCGASGGMGKTKEEAVRMWNLRAPLDHLKHEISDMSYNSSQGECVTTPELYNIISEEQETFEEIEV